MSKMPAKKKSCFQITSVTQAQVAANSIADGTQSLDDPDVSRAEIGGCDTLNNVGDPHEGIVNGGLLYSKGSGGRITPHSAGGSVSAAAAVAHTSCGSRFRVIKLDHGTGEPFRRGRWSCTEFYEKDSESNVSRTVDTSIKPAAATFDPSTERDSGLGANNGNSVVTSSAFSIQVSENSADSGYSVSAEAQHQGYSLPPQIGSGASAFQPAGFMSALQQAQVSVHPAGPQTFLTNSLNGMHQVAMSPIIAAVTQPQQLGYSTQAHTDYHQHHFGSSIQNPPMASLTVGSPPANQMPSPAITPGAAPGVQGLNGDAAQPHILQVGNSPAVTPVPGIVQHQPSGGSSITTASSISAITAQSGSQSVPAKVPSTSSPPTGLLSQVPATLGALVQAQGAHGGPATVTSNQPEDGRLKINALTQHSAAMVSARDGVKPLLCSDGLSLPTPAVNSLFGIHITMNVDDDSASGASVVAIDNKIEQAMDLVKSHLMYAVREEVEVMKEQIKELYERNSVLERENAVLKSLANSEQLNQLSSQLSHGSTSPPLQLLQHPFLATNMGALTHQESGQQSIPHQPNITSA